MIELIQKPTESKDSSDRLAKSSAATSGLRGSILGIIGHRTVVRVVYSDESGTGSIEEEPITVVAAIVINLDTQWEGVEADLDRVAPDENHEFKGA
ncbi:MAG TPA: hypothetical protein VGG60_12905, partial [Candidatus Binataceae bacterium]